MSLNRVMIIGRLGQDPEIRSTAQGTTVSKFSVATSKKIKEKDVTEWHKVVAFGKVAEICNHYLSKGSQVFIEGELQTNSWEDKEGTKRYTTNIVVQNVQFLGPKNTDGQGQSSQPKGHAQYTSDNIPF